MKKGIYAVFDHKVVLFLVFFCQVVALTPIQQVIVAAEEITSNEVTTTPTADYGSEELDISLVPIVSEDTTLRTSNEKYYRKLDGTYEVAIYPNEVHYLDDGQWRDIDNRLDGNESELTNKNNRVKTTFPKILSDSHAIKVKLDDYAIDWKVLDIESSPADYSTNELEQKLSSELIHVNQSVTYANIQEHVDLQYVLQGSDIKETIVLNDYVEDFSLSFEYSFKNLSVMEQEDGIHLVNAAHESVFRFEDLFMIDQEQHTSLDVTYEMEALKKDTYRFTIQPSDEWLKHASYPVSIDPTLSSTYNPITIYDTYVSEAAPTTNYGRSTYLMLANTSSSSEYRGLLRFVIPTVVMNKQITFATLQLSTSVKTNNRTLALYENQTSFIDYGSGGVTWNTRPYTSTSIVDYHVTESSTDYLFNITKSIQNWQFLGIATVPGYTICDKNLYGAYNSVKSIEYSTDSSLKPVIEIGYIDPAGIKDYWTYNSQQVGKQSTGYISDLTGLLNIVRNDLNFSTERQSLSLSFGYNVLDKATNYGYHKGWNIVYNSYVYFDWSLGLNYSQDFLGNKVYYHLTTCDSRLNPIYPEINECYLAEDGSNNVLIKKSIDEVLYGQDILSPSNVKQVFNSSGFLTSIINTKTNQTITITRPSSTSHLISKIDDSVGNSIHLTYSNGSLTKAQLYTYQNMSTSHLLEEVDYAYGPKNDGTGEYVLEAQYSKNYDVTLSMEASDSLYYDYDPDGRIVAHWQDERDLIEYTYNTSTSKVTNFKSFYNNYLFANIDYSYRFRETMVTNQTNDFIIYKFDSYGHTVNVLDSDGNVQFFRYKNLFSPEEPSSEETSIESGWIIDGKPNYRINHHLDSQSTPQSNLFNPINNQGFEYDGVYAEADWFYVDDNGELRELDRIEHYGDKSLFGSYSAMINSSTNDNGRFEQTVMLDEGAYTLTGYVWNQGTNNNVWIDVSGEDYGGAVTYVNNTSEWIKVTVTFGVYDDNTAVTVSLVNHTSGKAYFDNIEIYNGFVDNRTNMMENASFEMTGTTFPLPGWYVSNSAYVTRANIETGLDTIYQNILGDYALKIEGSATESRFAVAAVTDFMDSFTLEETGQLVIGSWALSNGTPSSVTAVDDADGNDRYFRIRVDFVSTLARIYDESYPSDVIKSEYINFDTSVAGWQYRFAQVTMPSTDTYWINVFYEYKGEGAVYFDGLQLFFEHDYTHYIYDDYGNLKFLQTSSGDKTEYIYDQSLDHPSTPTEIKLPDDTKVTITEDTNHLIDKVTYNNVSVTPSYNTYGQVTSMQVGDADTYFTTSTNYTHLSQYVTAQTDEFNNTTDFYNDTLTGLLQAIENAKGQDTHYIYDNEGKLVRVVSVDDYLNYSSGDIDALVEYMYDTQNRLSRIVLDDDYYYEITYDDQGRMEQIAVNTTPLMSYTYEMDGSYYTDRLSEQTYGNGDILKFTYDAQDRIETVQFKESTGAFVTKFSYEYDDYGHIAVYNTYENGSIVETEFYTYDSSGHLIQAVDEEGNITQYLYDDLGNLTSLYFVIDGSEATTNYTYNECFLYDEIYPNKCSETSSLYDYTKYTSSTGFEVVKDYHYETEALYRLDSINLTWSTYNIKQNFVYSGNTTRLSQITYELNGVGVDYKYTYDYDSLGNMIHESYYEGTTLKLYRNYEYDALNQLVVEDSRDYDFTIPSTLSNTNYTKFYYYDARGNRTDVKTFLFGQNDISFPSAPTYAQTNSGLWDGYMLYNGTKSYTNMYFLNVGQSPSLSFTYYDEWDIDHEYPLSGMTTTMTYNNLNTALAGYYYREYTATDGAYYTISFRIVFKVGTPPSYDTVPQEHLHYTYSSNWEDQLLDYGEIDYINGVPQPESSIQQYTYDAQGNPIFITDFVYEGVTYEGATLEWSGRDLSSITILENSLPVFQIRYEYNDHGYRTSKAFYTFSEGVPVLTETITYELIGNHVVYETNGTYAILFTYDYDGTLISFNYDANVLDAVNGTEYFYIRNQLGDITHLVDSTGVVSVHYLYDAYGTITYQTPSQSIGEMNPYRYRGYRYDEELSWYYLNSRYYSAATGRFLNSDGLLGEFGSILSTNMYVYCANNPVMNIDISGYSWQTFWKITGGVTVAVVAAVIVVSTGGGALIALAAVGGGYILGSNVATVIESEIYINNSDVSLMDKVKAESILAGDDTTGLSREDKLSYILYLQSQYPSRYSDWSTGQLLREFEYHDRIYYSFASLGFESDINGNWFEQQVSKAQYVDFEMTQTSETYFRRILGNAWPFGE